MSKSDPDGRINQAVSDAHACLGMDMAESLRDAAERFEKSMPLSEATIAQGEWCRRCNGPNVIWSASSPLWNYVMRGNDINGDPIHGDLVCMPCFIVLAVEVGLPSHGWRLTLVPEPEGLIYETPSGRVWDPEQSLWVGPEPEATS